MSAETMPKAIELNQVLGARHIIMASPPPNTTTIEDWTKVSAQLSTASEAAQAARFARRFPQPQDRVASARRRPARSWTCWRRIPRRSSCFSSTSAPASRRAPTRSPGSTRHPGRIRSVHLKDWAPGPEAQEKGYRVLFGEGVAPWKQILDAAESVGGVEFYLMEQEGSRFSELETAERCLATWRKMRGAA